MRSEWGEYWNKYNKSISPLDREKARADLKAAGLDALKRTRYPSDSEIQEAREALDLVFPDLVVPRLVTDKQVVELERQFNMVYDG